MKCSKCQGKMTQLFISWVCDTCNPVGGVVISSPTSTIEEQLRTLCLSDHILLAPAPASSLTESTISSLFNTVEQYGYAVTDVYFNESMLHPLCSLKTSALYSLRSPSQSPSTYFINRAKVTLDPSIPEGCIWVVAKGITNLRGLSPRCVAKLQII
jgi:hypothetical protein